MGFKQMIDPKHILFREYIMNYFIQGMGRSQIAAKWFFDHDACLLGTSGRI